MTASRIHDQARAFRTAAARCMEQRPLPNGGFQAPLVPAVVCLAFSIELNLKCILAFRGQVRRGHNLKSLYEFLPEADQAQLVSGTSMTKEAFESKLESVARAFEEWRYVFEQDHAHVDIQFLGLLADVIGRTAEQILDRPAFRRHPVAIIDGNDRGVYEQ